MDMLSTNVSVPWVPSGLEQLLELAYNLRWIWHQPTQDLFSRLDPSLWESLNRNPVALLASVGEERLRVAVADDGYRAEVERAARDLHAYMSDDGTWFRAEHGDAGGSLIAYFSAEYGLHECLPIYSGGLGVLAADHIKSASDQGLPLVAVGLAYKHGYFGQEISETGWQQERYDLNDFSHLPLQLEKTPDGAPLVVEVPFPDRPVYAQVWRAQVGRVPIYMLDTDVPANAPEDRTITDQLYGGDVETRIRQELVLGIGGYRLVEALGLRPAVCHMNEGHSAFMALERVRRLMEERGVAFHEARRIAAEGSVFTTHTPVAAGHDYFPPELMDRYLDGYRESLGIARFDFLALGRHNPHNDGEWFCQTILALRMSRYANGVSKLHGEVSREMWRDLYPDASAAEAPIGHITNGVHLPSFVSPRIAEMCDRRLGAGWLRRDADTLRREVEDVPAEELWRLRARQRQQLVTFVRARLRTQYERHGMAPEEARDAADVLNPDMLTIGFARRFATYKRATLLLTDSARLSRILNHPTRPVQVVFAGKAHPRDEGGKELIRRIVDLAKLDGFQGRLVFLEDYNIGVARQLVQGADVWLNNPQRPMEASGTSGMKAGANGVLNASTLDGWWDEAWEATASMPNPPGWAIGQGETYEHRGDRDFAESAALYDVLEREIAPLFYDRDEEGLPRGWIDRMKTAICTVAPVYNTGRMVREYAECYYLPAITGFRQAR